MTDGTTPTISIAKFPGFWIVKDADADETVEKDIAAGPCTLVAVRMKVTEATVGFLKLYDDRNPVLGTTDPVEQYPVPDYAVEPVDGFPVNLLDGLKFENGLSFACTTSAGTAGVTAPTIAGEGVVELELVIVSPMGESR